MLGMIVKNNSLRSPAYLASPKYAFANLFKKIKPHTVVRQQACLFPQGAGEGNVFVCVNWDLVSHSVWTLHVNISW